MSENRYVWIAGQTGRHFFTETEWKNIMSLARDYGWTPDGTQPPRDRDELSWDRSYCPAVGQTITAEDAQRFAIALDRAITDIPGDTSQPVTAPPHVAPASLTAMEYYRGPRVAMLQRLIIGADAGELHLTPSGKYEVPGPGPE
jgi:hypothetical protein